MSSWVVKFIRPLARPYDFNFNFTRRGSPAIFAAITGAVGAGAAMAAGAAVEAYKNRRMWRREKRGRKPDRTAEPLLRKDAPWSPRAKDAFASGESIRYWTGRYWSEEYARAFKYPSRDEAEIAMFGIIAMDVSLIGELETYEWVQLSKPAPAVKPTLAVAKPPENPNTLIVSKPKR
jgi:hypothetical protein